jgi:phi13 family phage major tail protein
MGVIIGLKNIHIAKLTKDDATGVTYDAPVKLAKAIEASITPNVNSSTLYADDGPSEVVTSLGEIEVSIGIDQLPTDKAALLLGHEVNADGVLVKKADDEAPYVALGFSSPTSDGKEKFVWLLKGKFQLPEEAYQTKGDSVEFQTATLTARFVKRDYDGVWQYSVNSGDNGVNQTVITNWFTSVYEPTP